MRQPKSRFKTEAARGLPNSAGVVLATRVHVSIQVPPVCNWFCLLQFPGSSTGTVCPDAIFRPSAALHIWQAFHQANLSDADVTYLAGIWKGATGQFVKAYRRQEGQPSPGQIPAATQEAKPSVAMFDSKRLATMHATYLPTVQDAVRPLLQLTQVLLSQSGFLLSCDCPERQVEFRR